MNKSGMDLMRVSLMLPKDSVAFIDAEVQKGFAKSRSEYVRVLVQKDRISKRMRVRSGEGRRIGSKTAQEIQGDYMDGTLDQQWLDALNEEDRQEVIKLLDELEGEK